MQSEPTTTTTTTSTSELSLIITSQISRICSTDPDPDPDPNNPNPNPVSDDTDIDARTSTTTCLALGSGSNEKQKKRRRRLKEEDIRLLILTCGETMVLGALDLIDHDEVSRIRTPHGREVFQVAGSTTSYTVQYDPDRPLTTTTLTTTPKTAMTRKQHKLMAYCPCPSFSSSVLHSRSHVICKHILAVMIAYRMDRLVQRDVDLDFMAAWANGFKGSRVGG